MSGINYQHMAGLLFLYYALLKFLFLTVSQQNFFSQGLPTTPRCLAEIKFGGFSSGEVKFPQRFCFLSTKKGCEQPEMRKKTLVRGISFQSYSEAMHRNSFFMYKIGCSRKRLIPRSQCSVTSWRPAEDFGIRADLGEIWWEAKPGRVWRRSKMKGKPGP